MRTVRLFIILIGLGGFGTLLYMLTDSAISLDHSRSQNEFLRQKCVLLAELADDGVRGKSVAAVKSMAGANVITKREDGTLWLDNVALRVDHDQVTGVDVTESCR